MVEIREFLFGLFKGFTNDDERRWRKLWSWLMALEPGDCATLGVLMPRSKPYHFRTMKIIRDVFESQERFQSHDSFLYWLKYGAEWVDWISGPKGGVIPAPRSLSFAKADQADFEKFTAQVLTFFRGDHAALYLWRHLNQQGAHAMMDSILNSFER